MSLAPIQNMPVSPYDDSMFTEISSLGGFLPRLNLMTSNSKVCKSGVMQANHYALITGSEHTDLGTEVDCLILSWRPKALEIDGENVLTVYDPKDPEFKRIMQASSTKTQGALYGAEYLVWIPSVKQMATLFMGGKSTRVESPSVKARIGQAATLKSRFIEKPKYSWTTIACIPCSTPLEMPDEAKVLEEVEKFLNPPVNQIEKAPVTESDRER